MATASVCTNFSTPFIPKTSCTGLSSILTSSSASKCPISLPKAKISFECKYPIALTRTMAYFSFEGKEETTEDPQEEGGGEEEGGSGEEEEEEEEEGDEEKLVTPFRSTYFDDVLEESELQIAKAFEAMYGPAYSGISVLGNDVDVMDSRFDPRGARKVVKVRDSFDEQVVQVRRVTKVVKGGRYSRMRAILVVGDRKGKVGVGVGKATDLSGAMQKAGVDARRHIISIPMTKDLTFPHRMKSLQ